MCLADGVRNAGRFRKRVSVELVEMFKASEVRVELLFCRSGCGSRESRRWLRERVRIIWRRMATELIEIEPVELFRKRKSLDGWKICSIEAPPIT